MQKQPFYVATAIPYVNDKPHLGHALLFTYGDVLARFYRSLDYQVVFSVGTDEHGGKIFDKATEANLSPQVFVDQMVQPFQAACSALQISYTHFIRTTDEAHCQRVQHIWQQLAPYIYQANYEGWYCQGCESYKTDTVVKDTSGVCPDHNRAYTSLQEKNYFFKLSAFADQLKEQITADQIKIVPYGAKAEALGWLEQGLQDISISRPKTNLEWGIDVPDDPSQVIYVWFEALMNYITVLDYPDGATFQTHWPANVQIIGKDILRFHALIWPAMLLGLNLSCYRQLYVHGLVTVDGQKMSKTLKNTVDPLELVAQYGLDAFRYFFLRHLPAYENGDYSLERFLSAYNNELVDQLGNLVHRLQTLIWQKLNGRLAVTPLPDPFAVLEQAATYRQAIADCRFDRALDLLFDRVKDLNRLLEVKQPWQLDARDAQAVLSDTVCQLVAVALLLEPFVPVLSDKIQQMFSTNPIQVVTQPLLPKVAVAPKDA